MILSGGFAILLLLAWGSHVLLDPAPDGMAATGTRAGGMAAQLRAALHADPADPAEAPPARFRLHEEGAAGQFATADLAALHAWGDYLHRHGQWRVRVLIDDPAADPAAPWQHRRQAAILRLLVQDGVDAHRVQLDSRMAAAAPAATAPRLPLQPGPAASAALPVVIELLGHGP